MMNKKIIYLAAYRATHPNYNIIYQDINGKRDISGDMLDIELSEYDIIIATPPCNYYSRANYRREISKYSISTKHLLPGIIHKLRNSNKKYIIENVRNDKLMLSCGIPIISDKNIITFVHGRHRYWTNVRFEYKDIIQLKDFSSQAVKLKNGMYLLNDGRISKTNRVKRLNNNTLGGDNVYLVIERFLQAATK